MHARMRSPLLELPFLTAHAVSKKGRGRVKGVRCESSAAMVPKDKAIKRFIVSLLRSFKLSSLNFAPVFFKYL